MKVSLWILTSSVLLVVLAACASDQQSRNSRSSDHNRFGHQGPASTITQYAPTPTPNPAVIPAAPSPTVQSAPTPTPQTSASTTTRNIPYGTPVPGKPGFVTSPHAPYAGYVDVRGFPPGTEVKCPYTSKIFLVP